MILSIDAEKAFVKIQHSIPIKALNKLEIERNLLNLIKHIYEKKKNHSQPMYYILETGNKIKLKKKKKNPELTSYLMVRNFPTKIT